MMGQQNRSPQSGDIYVRPENIGNNNATYILLVGRGGGPDACEFGFIPLQVQIAKFNVAFINDWTPNSAYYYIDNILKFTKATDRCRYMLHFNSMRLICKSKMQQFVEDKVYSFVEQVPSHILDDIHDKLKRSRQTIPLIVRSIGL